MLCYVILQYVISCYDISHYTIIYYNLPYYDVFYYTMQGVRDRLGGLQGNALGARRRGAGGRSPRPGEAGRREVMIAIIT